MSEEQSLMNRYSLLEKLIYSQYNSQNDLIRSYMRYQSYNYQSMFWKIIFYLIFSIQTLSLESSQNVTAILYCSQQFRSKENFGKRKPKQSQNLNKIQSSEGQPQQMSSSQKAKGFAFSRLIAPRKVIREMKISFCQKNSLNNFPIYYSIIFQSRGSSAIPDKSLFNRSLIFHVNQCINISLGYKDDINKHPYTNMTIKLQSPCQNENIMQKPIEIMISYSYTTIDQTSWIIQILQDILIASLLMVIFAIISCFCLNSYFSSSERQEQPNNQASSHDLNAKKDFTIRQNQLNQQNLCLLCLKKIQTSQWLTTRCPHSFNKQCIDSWLREDKECPVCKTLLKEGNHV